jgi:phosphate transport system protein
MMAGLRESYRRDLQDLHDQVLVLGSMVDKALERSVESLRRLDFALAERVIDEDRAVNRKRFEIEEQAIRLIATQQPMASDLRAIVAVLNIIVDLERIGDYAVGNARITLRHRDRELLKPLIDIPRMADRAREMLRQALDAFLVRDAARARRIVREDDEVDGLYEQIYRELLTFMLNDPQTIDRATWLMWVAHNLERCADRVTNICERIVYEATGRMEEIGASTY